MAVLIICHPVDIHASAMAWALQKCGTDALLWHPAPPWTPAGAARFDSASVDYRFPAKGGSISPSSVDAIWLRRLPKPVLPAHFRESDKAASRNELLAFHAGILELLPRSILWANPLDGRRSAHYKPRQLAAAMSVGLSIPRTIMTDDATQARDFVASRPEGQVIYKPFHPFHWERPGNEIYHTGTTPVAVADFGDPQALIWSPGIFQEYIPKAYELRVSLFGRTCVAAKMLSQDPVDGPPRETTMTVAPYQLPEAVERKLQALMDELGLVMGMVELIVTPGGEYVFLEVNEQGQFLWLEQMCPELPLLDIATRFLASGNPRFKAEAVPGSRIDYGRFLEEEGDRFRQEKQDFLSSGGNPENRLLNDCSECQSVRQDPV